MTLVNKSLGRWTKQGWSLQGQTFLCLAKVPDPNLYILVRLLLSTLYQEWIIQMFIHAWFLWRLPVTSQLLESGLDSDKFRAFSTDLLLEIYQLEIISSLVLQMCTSHHLISAQAWLCWKQKIVTKLNNKQAAMKNCKWWSI